MSEPPVAGVHRYLLERATSKLLSAAILFLSSGDLAWGMAWAYLGTMLVFDLFTARALVGRQPDLLAERTGVPRGGARWDRILVPILVTLLPMLTELLAGLDRRHAWSPRLSVGVQLVALAFVLLSGLLIAWAMASNSFFAAVVRIQGERGHVVASGGPYRLVRHPGYLGAIAGNLATAVALGSLWAIVPPALGVAGYVVRTALEERTLHAELPGYAAYAQRVRYRLIPGLW